MDKKQIRKCYKMDLRHFLESYYGADNEKVVSKLCNLSHKELKKIALLYGIKLVRVNFDSVTLEQLAKGEIILVNDVFNNPAPYINPNRRLDFNQEFDTELDDSYVNFEEKTFQKCLKKIVKLRKGDKK